MRKLIAAVIAMLGLGAVPASATVWDYSGDFAVVLPQVGQGPGNAWWYFKADAADLDGSYTPFTTTEPGVYGSAGAFHYLSNGGGHPGDTATMAESNIVIGFRAPAADTYSVEGFFRDGNGGDPTSPDSTRGVDVSIAHDTTSVIGPTHLDVNVGGAAVPDQLDFDFDIALDAGDWLFFRVHDRGRYFFDGTIIEIQISDEVVATPEPGGMLAASFVMLAAARRFRRRT